MKRLQIVNLLSSVNECQSQIWCDEHMKQMLIEQYTGHAHVVASCPHLLVEGGSGAVVENGGEDPVLKGRT